MNESLFRVITFIYKVYIIIEIMVHLTESSTGSLWELLRQLFMFTIMNVYILLQCSIIGIMKVSFSMLY